jgi:hypothetical protein
LCAERNTQACAADHDKCRREPKAAHGVSLWLCGFWDERRRL